MSESEKMAMAQKLRELTENAPFIFIMCDRTPGSVFPEIHSIMYAHPVDGKSMLQYAEDTIKPRLE